MTTCVIRQSRNGSLGFGQVSIAEKAHQKLEREADHLGIVEVLLRPKKFAWDDVNHDEVSYADTKPDQEVIVRLRPGSQQERNRQRERIVCVCPGVSIIFVS